MTKDRNKTDHGITAFERRPLSVAERDLIGWLLTRGAHITGTDAKVATSFLPEIGDLQVIGQCGCGCPSVELALAGPNCTVPGNAIALADVEGQSPEGTEIGVILRAANGSLKTLELYARDGRVPFSLPGTKELESFG